MRLALEKASASSLVDREAEGVGVTRTIMADSRNAANVTLAAVKVGNDALLGAGYSGDTLDQALDIARIGLSAEMLSGIKEFRTHC